MRPGRLINGEGIFWKFYSTRTRTSPGGTSRLDPISRRPCSQNSGPNEHVHQKGSPPTPLIRCREDAETISAFRERCVKEPMATSNQAPLFVRVSNTLTVTLCVGASLRTRALSDVYCSRCAGAKVSLPRTVPIVIWEHDRKRYVG